MRTPSRIIFTVRRSRALLLILCGLTLCRSSPAQAQPDVTDPSSGPNWRSALIMRFDPLDPPPRALAGDSAGDYLSAVVQALESGWVTATGADAISVGPFVASGIDPGMEGVGAAVNSSPTELSAVKPSAGKPSAGKPSDTKPSATKPSAADHAAIDPPLGSDEEWESLLAAARRAGVPMIVTSPKTAGRDLHSVWIAGASEEKSFDAYVEEMPGEGMDDVNALKAVFKSLSERVASEHRPIITSIPIRPRTTPFAERMLLIPGAVQFAAAPMGAENGELWRVVAAFRQRHPAVATGEHEDLANSTYSFARTSHGRNVDDAVIVALAASGTTTLNVSHVFADNTLLHDAVTGSTAFVSFGMATFEADASGVMLIEEAQ